MRHLQQQLAGAYQTITNFVTVISMTLKYDTNRKVTWIYIVLPFANKSDFHLHQLSHL